MRFLLGSSLAARALLATLLMVVASGTSHADQIFNFVFDDNDIHAGLPYPPIVGQGSLTLANPQTDGVYSLSSLTGFSMNFEIFGIVWTEADIAYNFDNAEVVIYDGGTAAYISDNGITSNFSGGSLDLINSEDFLLAFSPSYFLPVTGYLIGDLQLEFDDIFGTYGPTAAVPEPSSLALFGLGGLSLAIAACRRRLAV